MMFTIGLAKRHRRNHMCQYDSHRRYHHASHLDCMFEVAPPSGIVVITLVNMIVTVAIITLVILTACLRFGWSCRVW